MPNGQNRVEWMEYLRVIETIIIFVVSIYVAGIDRKIENMSQQIFHHLTNDEIHTPRTLTTTKAEFQIYQIMRSQQIDDLRDQLKEISDLIKLSIKNSAGRVR